MPETPRRYYVDPVDAIWLAAAHRIGLRVVRSKDVYASTDGQGVLYIGEQDTLDPDDSLAQLVFHEFCHALVEGPDRLATADWGLCNVSDKDVTRERACLRLQAWLSARFGLRGAMAPTTEFRAFYEELPDDPLQGDQEDVRAAKDGGARAEQAPWAPHLQVALIATAAVFRIAKESNAQDPNEKGAPIWERLEKGV